MPTSKTLNYYVRDFASIRTEITNFIKQFYPDTYQDFSDASIGSMLIDLLAGLGDNISFNIDNAAQETILDFAQEKSSHLSIARTYGLKIPFKRPAVTLVDFTVDLPVDGNSFNLSYAPIILKGAQARGAGQIFETRDDIDFSNPFNSDGIPNRIIIPNFDTEGNIISYSVTKREIVYNGRTKVFKRIFTGTIDNFTEIILPDNNVLYVDQVISLDGTNYNTLPTLSQQFDENNKWYEVENLIEQQVFQEDVLLASDQKGVKVGRWKDVTKKFVTEFTDKGFLKLRFGAGQIFETDTYENYITDSSLLLDQLNDIANSLAFGEKPKANTTMFITYKVGGGVQGNVGANVLNTKGDISLFVQGPNGSINTQVRSSLKINNPIPAFGGADELSTEEIKNLIKYNFAAQQRCVTEKDYLSRIYLMDGRFGSPFQTTITKDDNKVKAYIVSLDASGN
jgi:archaellin